jgi:phosphohistidine phosphatase SixA
VIYLVREADSGERSEWPGPDMLRPITKDGWRQARALVQLLDGLAVRRVLSSPYLRCRQTVGLLAEQRELEVESERLLSDCFPVEMTLSVLRSQGPGPAVVCTHSPVMDELLARIGAADGSAPGLSWLRALDLETIGIAL